jgi:hypothetical protein
MIANDYILYLHGVSTREEGVKPRYADRLIDLISKYSGERTIINQELYWGNVADNAQQFLREEISKSPDLNRLWFKE